jgi:hypothetical protein
MAQRSVLRTHGYDGVQFGLQAAANDVDFGVGNGFPTAVDRFVRSGDRRSRRRRSLEAAGAALRARAALRQRFGGDHCGNRELLTLHELIAHRLFQILIGQNRGRKFSV